VFGVACGISSSIMPGTLSSMLENERRAKVRENKVRRMAERQGLQLVKSRRRDPLAIDFGTYWLVGEESGARYFVPSTADIYSKARIGYTIDEAEGYLLKGRFPDVPTS
jgi:hypothetical protein